MTPEQFAYWLQGFSEINGTAPPTPEQWRIIKDHLQLVFKKETSLYDWQLDIIKEMNRPKGPKDEWVPPPRIIC